MVPYYYDVKVRRPLGLHVAEGPNKKVYVQNINPGGGAEKTKQIQIGDQVVSLQASWGDRMWEVNSVESFVVSIRMRSDPSLNFKMKRLMSLAKFIKSSSNRFVRKDYSMSYRSRVMGLENNNDKVPTSLYKYSSIYPHPFIHSFIHSFIRSGVRKRQQGQAGPSPHLLQ